MQKKEPEAQKPKGVITEIPKAETKEEPKTESKEEPEKKEETKDLLTIKNKTSKEVKPQEEK